MKNEKRRKEKLTVTAVQTPLLQLDKIKMGYSQWLRVAEARPAGDYLSNNMIIYYY